MYAHQVIEDLRYWIRTGTPGTPMTSLYQNAILPIQKAQKFHVGSIEHLTGVAGIKPGTDLFMCQDNVKLPYTLCWFDWEVIEPDKQKLDDRLAREYAPAINTAEAVLVKIIAPNRYHVVPFTRFQCFPKPIWAMNLVSIEIIVGKGARSLTIEGLTDDQVKVGSIEAAINCQFLEMSLRLLNCKNISTEVIKAPEALNKKRRKNGKQEIFDYHVLNVVVPSTKQGYREQSEPLSHVRVHLCRGHFKEYTQEHPLFGKLTGLYWWQPHVRGQNKDGIVMKNYAIKTKEAT